MALFGKGKKKDKAAEEGKEEDKVDDKKEDDKKEDIKEGDGEATAEGEGGAKKPKKSKKKIIIMGVLALVVLLGGAAGAYFGGFIGGDKHEEAADSKEKDPSKTIFYSMPEFLVNLNATGKSTSFLKTTVILELHSQVDIVTVEANLPRLMDAFNTYLRELRASDLAGSAGIQRLREELLLRCNKVLAPTEISDVLFKEIVVQ
ncbi:MAG: flagellar basal body-associated FliL family protein [Alphaproteobacteria bacterium]|jgi:flagellar FliL protein